MGTTPAGLLVLVLSCSTAAGGAYLVKRAHAVPAPVEPAHRVLPGTVTEVLAAPCSSRRSRGTCFRTVVGYQDRGEPGQVSSRAVVRPAPHNRGDALNVAIESDGTAWIEEDLKRRHGERRADYERVRGFPLTMGWLLVGCGAFGGLLGFGLIFWVDRSETA